MEASKLKLYTVKYALYLDVEAYSEVQAVNVADVALHGMSGAEVRELIEGTGVEFQMVLPFQES
jgi:FixJ family two-component response regulator